MKEDVQRVLRENRGEIKTSVLGVAERFIVLYRKDYTDDLVAVAEGINEIFDLMDIDEEKVLNAAIYMEKQGLTPFDAFRAALSEGMPILSSNEFYEDIDTENRNLSKK